MEKMVSFPEKRVRDLGGLYLALQKAGYAVRNVGADALGTYIYLEETEEKTPAALVDEWVEKPPQSANDKKAFATRKAQMKEAEESYQAVRATEEAAKIVAAAAEKAAAEAAALGTSAEPVLALPVVEPPSPPKENLLTRILKSIW